MIEGEAVGDVVREKAGSQILHIGSESHCEDLGCYSGCDGNTRKTEFHMLPTDFMFYKVNIGFSNLGKASSRVRKQSMKTGFLELPVNV